MYKVSPTFTEQERGMYMYLCMYSVLVNIAKQLPLLTSKHLMPRSIFEIVIQNDQVYYTDPVRSYHLEPPGESTHL